MDQRYDPETIERRIRLSHFPVSEAQQSEGGVEFGEVGGTGGFFGAVPQAPEDPILGVTLAFNADKAETKLNLGVGAYRTEEGKPWVLPVVKKAEAKILADPAINKEYLPIEGLAAFREVTGKLLYGAQSPAIAEKRLAVVQALSGTGALRLGCDFIREFFPKDTPLYLPIPTWGNHNKIAAHARVPVKTYRYYKPETRGLDFENLIADLRNAPNGAVILLHVCAHNPTGVDPTREQWSAIADVMQAKGLFPFFDCAYQGFATGDIEADAFAIRLFVERGFELFAAQSYSKNFGLYSERIGALSAVTHNAKVAEAVKSQLKTIARPMYSNPPIHGALIVATVLQDQALTREWEENVKTMAGRIISMRHALFDALKMNGCPGDWTHILKQIGMFTFTGLNAKQVERLTKQHHCYMTGDGRISMAGLNTRNVKYLADAIKDVVLNQ